VNVFVLDHTALAALGAGHRYLSRVIRAVHDEPDWHVYVPALCLAAAEAGRQGLADHVGALPAIEVVELGYAAASAVGRLVASGVDWRLAQAVHTGRPTIDWPTGRPIVTAEPKSYSTWGVDAIALQN
jgi:hypothetical protein